MYVEIITPQKTLYTGNAYILQLPGKEGAFEIMHKHAPIISILTKGTIKVVVKKDQSPEFFDIMSGVVEVKKDKAMVMAETE